MREPHRQICPWFWKDERRLVLIASSMSASAKTTFGFLPPSSSESFLNFGATTAAIEAPVAVPPVNETALTSECPVNAGPTLGPKPCTMLSTPGGRPAALTIRARWNAVIGVISEGLATTVFPAASAGAIFHVNR